MGLIKILLVSSRAVVSSALISFFIHDPIIIPEYNCYDNYDDKNKNHNIVVFDDDSLEPGEFITFIKKISRTMPGKYILYTGSEDTNYISSFISSGLGGIISKSTDAAILREGILKVANGKRFYCDNIGKTFCSNNKKFHLAFFKTLSTREKEILFLSKEGVTSKEVAARLCLSIKTVGRHKENIKNKLGLHHTSEIYKI